MIFSMTGYGTATGNSGNLAVTVELKSVNNRFLDVSVRLPRLYSFAEEALKGLVQQRLGRGKVDVFVNIDASKDDSVVIRLNEPVLKAYQAAFGPAHPNTIMALGYVASIYYAKNDFGEILKCYRQALEACEQCYGSDHPNTQKYRDAVTAIEEKMQKQQSSND